MSYWCEHIRWSNKIGGVFRWIYKIGEIVGNWNFCPMCGTKRSD